MSLVNPDVLPAGIPEASADRRPADNSRRSYRVLMIAPTSFFADYGCHVRILEEARILQKLGHSVTVVAYHNGDPVPGLDIRRTLPIPWRQHYEVGSSRHKLGFDALLLAKTAGLLARERYDVIHAHLHEGALIGNILGRLTRTPLAFDFQGSLTAEMLDHHFLKQESAFYKPLLRLEGWLDRVSPAVFTSSARAQQLLLEKFHCRPDRVFSLPDCVNAEAFRPASQFDPGELTALRDRLGVPAGRKVIVYLGLLAEYQGTGLLLQAMTRLVNRGAAAHLLLMGFPNVDHYRRLAAELGIAEHVTFTGRVPYEQAPIHLALGDVAVAPKLSLTEGSGKLLNYMAAGLPTVAFDTPVAREYLAAEGIYATPGDVEDLADKLLACLASEPDAAARRVEMGQRLRQRSIQRYSWESAGQTIVDVYRRLLGETAAQAVPARPVAKPMGGEQA
jgi:glycosyltransferase involved in cell wall biosynthesis